MTSLSKSLKRKMREKHWQPVHVAEALTDGGEVTTVMAVRGWLVGRKPCFRKARALEVLLDLPAGSFRGPLYLRRRRINERFAKYLAAAMARRGLSAVRLAAAMSEFGEETSYQTVLDWMRGSTPSLRKARILAQVLGVGLEALFEANMPDADGPGQTGTGIESPRSFDRQEREAANA